MRFYRFFSAISLVAFLFLSVPVSGQDQKHFLWEPVLERPNPFLYQTAASSARTHLRNVRAHQHKKFTRVVMDLSANLSTAPKDTRSSTHFQIELFNTDAPGSAIAKIRKKKFPLELDVSSTSRGTVLLTVPIEGWKGYKWYSLSKPSRLVLDLYPSQSSSVAKIHPEPVETKSPPLPKAILPPIPEKRDFIVVVDPGHGGKDPGALGKSGTREKDVVLKIATELRKILEREPSVKVLMTRENDAFIELEDRAEFANKEKADLFLSIHINSHPKSSVKGLELYHFGEASDPRALEVAARENGTPLEDNAPAWQFILADKLNDKKIDDSREFAWTTKKALVTYLKSYYKIKDHGVKTAPFFVLRMTTMPAILAEIAFISNPTEEKLLKSRTYQQRIAKGIYEGIKSYLTPLQTASR